jgi:adenylyl cyclase-associated protein
MEILTDLQKQMGTVNDIREANRGSPLFTHLSTVSEGIAALAWVTYEPKPANYLTEILSSAQFYGNRVLKEYKEKYVNIFSVQRL